MHYQLDYNLNHNFGCKTNAKFKKHAIFNIIQAAVILPEEAVQDASAIMGILNAITPTEIECRRHHLQQIAPLLQWGPPTKRGFGAFELLLAALLAEPET